jgi:hypothetical protein
MPTTTGTIRLQVVPSAPLAPGEEVELKGTVESFFEALRLGLLSGSGGNVHGIQQLDGGAIDARLEVHSVEAGAWLVLHGMLEYFAQMVAPLGSVLLTEERSGLMLPMTTGPRPICTAPLPFAVDISLRNDAAPPLVATVTLDRALSDEEKDRLERELRVWIALVHGGYPAADHPPGNSAMGPLSIRFDDSRTLVLDSDAFFAGEECFEPLKALLVQWGKWVPVVSLEIE